MRPRPIAHCLFLPGDQPSVASRQSYRNPEHSSEKRRRCRLSCAISFISDLKAEFDISSHANGGAVERSRGKTYPLHYAYCAPCQTVRQSSDDFDTRKPAIGHEKGAENDRSLEPIDTRDFRIFHHLFIQYCYRF